MNIESSSALIESGTTNDAGSATDDAHRQGNNAQSKTNDVQSGSNNVSGSANNASIKTNNVSGRASNVSRRATPAPFSRELLQNLDLNEAIGQEAARTEYAAVLTPRGITSAEVATFQSENLRCRGLLSQSLQSRTSRGSATRTEKSQATELLRLIRKAQSAALQQYDSDPLLRPRLADFGVGVDIKSSHDRLAQYSASILQCLKTNPLMALAPGFTQALADTRAEWLASSGAQASAKQAAMTHLQEAKTLADSLLSVRLRIQYAIDGAFPYDEVESAPARVAFHLPATRPFRTPARR